MLSFSREEVQLFSELSSDRNPLHLAEEFARSTPFGRPVVFGILVAIKAASFLEERSLQSLKSLKIKFLSPVFLDESYAVVCDEPVGAVVRSVRVFDGRRLTLSMVLEYEKGAIEVNLGNQENSSLREVPQLLLSRDLIHGYTASGKYRVDFVRLGDWVASYGLDKRGLGLHHIIALLWSSYIVGMEIPGLYSLFSAIQLDFYPILPAEIDLDFNLNVRQFDARFDRVEVEAELGSVKNQTPFARARIQAYLRRDIGFANRVWRAERTLDMTGTVALVTGASRGLGAFLAAEMVERGCTVVGNFHRSRDAALHLQASLDGASGRFFPDSGDICDQDYASKLISRIKSQHGRLDFLICSACPPLLPYWVESCTVERINQHISESVAMVSVPLATSISFLNENHGTMVLISSAAVSSVNPDWPHYIAGKAASEALVSVAAAQYPDVSWIIARPPLMLTDRTNTPLGSISALDPGFVAEKILERLDCKSDRKGPLILETFEL